MEEEFAAMFPKVQALRTIWMQYRDAVINIARRKEQNDDEVHEITKCLENASEDVTLI